jgi:hypothetical protein
MGYSALGTLGFGGLATGVAVAEWWTRGRHHLIALSLALTVLTFVGSFAGATIGMLRVNEGLAAQAVAANEVLSRSLAAHGYVEAMGNVPFGFALGLVPLMITALAWRRARIGGAGVRTPPPVNPP